MRSLADEVSLELSERSEHMEDEFSRWRGCINLLIQAFEANAFLVQCGNGLNQVFQ